MKKENFGFDKKAKNDNLAKIELLIPKEINGQTSIQLQTLLVEFWEMILDNFSKREALFDKALELCDKIDEAFLYRTFSKIEWSK